MSNIEKQFFCTDPNICAIIAKCNSQNKWELWGLSEVFETGEAKYEIRLFPENEYDAVEPINTTSGHTHIKFLQNNDWHNVVFIERKKATDKPIEPNWRTCFSNPPLLELFFDYEDENESIESLLERGAGKNQTVLIDLIDSTINFSQRCDERLLHIVDYFLTNGIDVNAKNEWGKTALMAAAYYGNSDIVSLLLQRGAKINDRNNEGRTALMYMEYSDYDNSKLFLERQTELLQLLLDSGADINAKDDDGKTALMFAIESKNKYISEYLIQQGAVLV